MIAGDFLSHVDRWMLYATKLFLNIKKKNKVCKNSMPLSWNI